MAVWNPWLGCHKKSEGCDNCYIHRANERKGINTDIIYKTDEFYKPVEKDKKDNYKIKSGQIVFVCFNSDFFVEEADEWRKEAWQIMKKRNDLKFLFLTKRIERFEIGLPEDFSSEYEHVTICTTIENQKRADERLSILKKLPIKNKIITIQPLIERIDISKYLDETINSVVVGGESGKDVRPLNFDWVLEIREQCINKNINFEFRQIGSIFIKNGNIFKTSKQYLCSKAKSENINYKKM
jgi:protein gp37